MNQGNLVLKTCFSLNAGQLLHVHLHPVPACRQVVSCLFALPASGELLLPENPEHGSPVGKRVAVFEFPGDADRTMVRIIPAVLQYSLPVGLGDYLRQLMRSGG
jgi:hypothetical protein